MSARVAKLRHGWRMRRLAGRRLLRAFAQAYPEAAFVEIGANDGAQHDHLRPFIVEGRWRGVMVEPVPYVFERLQANYAGIDRVVCENAAIADREGRMPFFHLAQTDEPGLPSWYDGIGSFSRSTLLSHERMLPDIAERLVTTEVPTLSFDALVRKHGLDRVDLVLIDTEGYDAQILKSIDLAAHAPRLVIYEHYHLDPEDRAATRERLSSLGYELLEEWFDTFALRAGDDRLTRSFRRLRPQIPGLSAADEELPLHDPSVPLPPGAHDELRDDHPRLAELREAYAAVGLPASRWDPARVGAFLDLRYFRGETLITWHYREERRLTELKYYAWLRAAADRDRLGLLGRLEEDGAFGCWTYEFPGHPRVSRDLLESVDELDFLERVAGLAPGTRVLDVGAGYGRLAHRVTAAFDVADYCCTDGVPESTFVCEYYLRHRGLAPPARVAGLHEVGALRPGSFDLAVNVHSFSECPRETVRWWLDHLRRLEVPRIFAVPNEAAGFTSTEPDGTRLDLLGSFADAGYALTREEPAILDPAVRNLLRNEDRHLLFERA